MVEAVRSAGGYLLDAVHTPSASLALLHAAIPAAFVLPSSLQQQPSMHPPSAQVVVDTSGRSAGNVILQSMSLSGSETTNLCAMLANCHSPVHSGPASMLLREAQQQTTPVPGMQARSGFLQTLLQGARGEPSLGDNARLGCSGRAACPLACASPPKGAEEGFSIHPASADSCMHVGTLCGDPDGRIRVPGALGAFLAEPLGSQGTPTAGQAGGRRCSQIPRNQFNEKWAVGRAESELPDGTRPLSFSLSGHGRSPGMVLAELEAKVVRLDRSGMSVNGMAHQAGPTLETPVSTGNFAIELRAWLSPTLCVKCTQLMST